MGAEEKTGGLGSDMEKKSPEEHSALPGF